jgi:predicted dehydrogenase
MNEASSSGVKFGIMYNQRTDGIYRKMHSRKGRCVRQIRRTNWIATMVPSALTIIPVRGGDMEGRGGGFAQPVPHNLDIWQWICGMPVLWTAYAFGKWHDIEVEDDVTVMWNTRTARRRIYNLHRDVPGTNRFE